MSFGYEYSSGIGGGGFGGFDPLGMGGGYDNDINAGGFDSGNKSAEKKVVKNM